MIYRIIKEVGKSGSFGFVVVCKEVTRVTSSKYNPGTSRGYKGVRVVCKFSN